jgi:hypothetical protein
MADDPLKRLAELAAAEGMTDEQVTDLLRAYERLSYRPFDTEKLRRAAETATENSQ